MTKARRRLWLSAVVAVTVAGGGTAVAMTSSSGGAVVAGAPGASPVPTVASPAAGGPGPAGPGAVAPVRAPAADRAQRDEAVRDARAALRRHGKEIRAARGERYRPGGVVVDPNGARHVRFERTYRGLEVLSGDFVVHARPDGDFRAATVAQAAPIDVDTEPAVSKSAATATATGRFTGTRRKATATLVVDAADGKPVLAWRVVVQGERPDGRPSALNVVIDARTGAVRRAYDDVHTAEEGTGRGLQVGQVRLSTRKRADASYELVDPLRGDGEVRDARNANPLGPDPSHGTSDAMIDKDNAWGDGSRRDRATLGVDVHFGLQETWDYFKETHGRTGVGDDGKGTTAYVHFGVSWGNAAWSDECKCVMFGDGDADPRMRPYTDVETVAHEMTHGITSATANLNYFGEAGGLNEAVSDIYGLLVEHAANIPVDPPDYLVGEQANPFGDGRPLRWMDDPIKDGLSPSCWRAKLGTADPHYSSGVGNKFFYNLAVGSGKSRWGNSPTCGRAPAVTGIGNDKAGRIVYRALTVYLVSTSTYAAARRATLDAATDLYGVGSAEGAAVDAAWRAVGVDGSDPASQAPEVRPFGPHHAEVGDAVSVQLKAVDPQADRLTFTAQDLPPGLSISPTGLISGTVTAEGFFVPEVTATDPAGNSDSELGLFDVHGPPVVTSVPADQTGVVGMPFALDVKVADRDPNALKATAVGLPDGVVAGGYHGPKGSMVIAGTPSAAGSGTATVTITDSTNRSATVSFPWTVTVPEPPAAPTGLTVTGGPNGTAKVGWQPPGAVPAEQRVKQFTVTTVPAGPKQTQSDQRSATVTGFKPNVDYQVTVTAVGFGGHTASTSTSVPGTRVAFTKPTAIVNHGATITMSGKLTRTSGAAVARQSVTLEARANGKVTTKAVPVGANGAWSTPAKPGSNTTFRVLYNGGAGLLGTASVSHPVSVRYVVTAKASKAKPKAREKITISGVVRPARANTTVTLQRVSGKQWVAIATAKTRANGSYTIPRVFQRGTWSLRVVVLGGAVNATGASAQSNITAK